MYLSQINQYHYQLFKQTNIIFCGDLNIDQPTCCKCSPLYSLQVLKDYKITILVTYKNGIYFCNTYCDSIKTPFIVLIQITMDLSNSHVSPTLVSGGRVSDKASQNLSIAVYRCVIPVLKFLVLQFEESNSFSFHDYILYC